MIRDLELLEFCPEMGIPSPGDDLMVMALADFFWGDGGRKGNSFFEVQVSCDLFQILFSGENVVLSVGKQQHDAGTLPCEFFCTGGEDEIRVPIAEGEIVTGIEYE